MTQRLFRKSSEYSRDEPLVRCEYQIAFSTERYPRRSQSEIKALRQLGVIGCIDSKCHCHSWIGGFLYQSAESTSR